MNPINLNPQPRAFLAELENIEALHRRAEELEAPPSPPYRGLSFAHLREAHDRLYYGAWRTPAATVLDLKRAYRQIDCYLDALSGEIERSRSAEGKKFLEHARRALAQTDADVSTSDVLSLDNALAYAHRTLNALLRQYRMATHDSAPYSTTSPRFRFASSCKQDVTDSSLDVIGGSARHPYA